jgi:hypothetical protein
LIFLFIVGYLNLILVECSFKFFLIYNHIYSNLSKPRSNASALIFDIPIKTNTGKYFDFYLFILARLPVFDGFIILVLNIKVFSAFL